MQHFRDSGFRKRPPKISNLSKSLAINWFDEADTSADQ